MITDFYRNARNTSADEKGNAASKWLAKLSLLRIDTSKVFPKAHEYLDRAQNLYVNAGGAKAAYTALANDLASRVADGTLDTSEIGPQITQASTDMVVEDRTKEILKSAINKANIRAYEAFNIGEDKLLALLRPISKSLLEQIRKSATQIPEETYTDAAAAKLGRDVQKAWIDVKADLALLNELHDLADDWRASFILDRADITAEKYHRQSFRYRTPALRVESMVGPRGEAESAVSHFIRNLDAEPDILTVAEANAVIAQQMVAA